jgi:peptidoglycan/xylan/chitin deacetylase (PgdA/CDA1 family)
MGAILCFHSLTTRDLPGAGGAHVPARVFISTVRLARRLGELVPLATIVERHQRRQSTAGLVAVTFDDAYSSLGEIADFVADEEVPITVFVTTDAMATAARFWWDRVDDSFGRVPPERWRAFEDACGLPEEYRRRQPAAYGPLRPLRQWILARYAGRWPGALAPALAALERDAGAETRHRAMGPRELAAFARLPTVDIGVHTLSHPVLPLLGDAELRQEITGCHDRLRAAFPRVQPIVALPFALYDRRTVEIARAAGMATSLTLSGGRIGAGTDPRALPRLCATSAEGAARLALRLVGLPDLVRPWRGRRLPAYPDLPSAAT